jgi:hypothetical protein
MWAGKSKPVAALDNGVTHIDQIDMACWALAFMAWWRAIQVALAALDTGSIAVSLDDRVEDRLNVATKAAEAMVTATMA